jgi:hypothetical protein
MVETGPYTGHRASLLLESNRLKTKQANSLGTKVQPALGD